MNYYSQAGQDLFVLEMLKKKRDGYFIEFGAYHSKSVSNTYLLESEYGWSGIGFDNIRECALEYNLNRRSKCLEIDALEVESYEDLFELHNVPKQVDYLQLDIDPSFKTLDLLKMLPLDQYRFSVITFEHDLFRGKTNPEWSDYESHDQIQFEQQEIFKYYGYELMTVATLDNERLVPFEDWWIDPSVVKLDKPYIYKPTLESSLYKVAEWYSPKDTVWAR